MNRTRSRSRGLSVRPSRRLRRGPRGSAPVNTSPWGWPGYDVVDPLLALYLFAKEHPLSGIKGVRCDCPHCEEVGDRIATDPDDCYARRAWPVFTFVESPKLEADIREFESWSSGTDWATMIERARKT